MLCRPYIRGHAGYREKIKLKHTSISDLIFSNRLFIASPPDIFDFIIVTRRLMEAPTGVLLLDYGFRGYQLNY